MNKEIELLIQKNTLRDLEIKLREALLNNSVIPDLVFEIMKNLEDSYLKVDYPERNETNTPTF